MPQRTSLPSTIDVDVTTHGEFPGADEYVRRKIGRLSRLAHRPVLHARVRLTRHGDPAVEHPVVAQANLDADGSQIRAQAEGTNAREAIDRLEARLRVRLEHIAEHWGARRGRMPSNRLQEWRHESEPAPKRSFFPRRPEEREVVRRKSFTMVPCTVDEAALDMEMFDYDFHLFTEKGTGCAAVLYKDRATGYRLALVAPDLRDQLSPFRRAVTISSQPVPCLARADAVERLNLLGLPFLFYIDAAEGRASVLYRRYDGHYGLITPSA